MFLETDADMVEVNPLVVTEDDQVIAHKNELDDNAMFRHPNIVEMFILTRRPC